MNFQFQRSIAVVLALTTTLFCAVPRASAMLAPAEMNTAHVSSAERVAEMQNVQSFLEQKQVRQRLMDFGLTEDQVQSRLHNLSDQQLHQVALHIDKENPAADGGGVVVTVLVIGILALLFVYLLKRV